MPRKSIDIKLSEYPVQQKREHCALFLPSGEDGSGQSPGLSQRTDSLRVRTAILWDLGEPFGIYICNFQGSFEPIFMAYFFIDYLTLPLIFDNITLSLITLTKQVCFLPKKLNILTILCPFFLLIINFCTIQAQKNCRSKSFSRLLRQFFLKFPVLLILYCPSDELKLRPADPQSALAACCNSDSLFCIPLLNHAQLMWT